MNLNKKLTITPATCRSPNLASEFAQTDLEALGACVWEGYELDLGTRVKWEERSQAAMDLAMQVTQDKSFPWPNCANVQFPLVTIASLQFHSRAYPALVSGTDIVKCRVVGEDPDGKQKERAVRISCHMSYQVLEEDESWEEQHDRLLIVLPILGCAFKKTYRDAERGCNTSELVFPKHLVLNYYAKSVESCPRKTHVIPMLRNELYERMATGKFKNYRDEAWFQGTAVPHDPAQTTSGADARTGTLEPRPDDTTPFTILEQYCLLDLDDDGYAEPYIVTIEAETKSVLRIVARWNRPEDVVRDRAGNVIRIEAEENFTKYGLIPSPDGSIYDIGFGVLLGPLNESVNSLINMMLDAGVMHGTGGGFLGRGVKIRGGNYSFAPNEWKRVDSVGDDLRKNIVERSSPEPSSVLFNLLSLLINYTERISGSTDMMVGENPGQNTPAETSRTMVEQGMKIYTAIFKRVWRSMKQEFKKLYVLNGMYLDTSVSYGDKGQKALREDYMGDSNRIVPAADPSVVSESARIQQAVTIKQSSGTTAGYNKDEVERNLLRSMKVEGMDLIFPGSDKIPPGESEKITIEKMKLQAKQMELQLDSQKFTFELMEQRRLNTSQIILWEAQAAKAAAEAGDVTATTQVTAFQTMVAAAKEQNAALTQKIDHMLEGIALQHKAIELGQNAQELALKNKELEIKKNAPAKQTA